MEGEWTKYDSSVVSVMPTITKEEAEILGLNEFQLQELGLLDSNSDLWYNEQLQDAYDYWTEQVLGG